MKSEASDVRIRLANSELWEKFHSCTTEMVVTRNGRKMFPKLEFLIDGMDPEMHYGLCLQIERVDDSRYKFQAGDWVTAGRAEPAVPVKPVFHHDGVRPGSSWMKSPINFERVKITNNQQDTSASNIYLQSMHKYVPKLTVYRIAPPPGGLPIMPMTSSEAVQVASSQFKCTEFVVVTAYQNQTITQLKIKHNPFAKGFRDGGVLTGDRKRSASPSSSSSPSSPKRYQPMVSPFGTPAGLGSLAALGTPPGKPFGGLPFAMPQFGTMPASLQFYSSPLFNPLLLNNMNTMLAQYYGFPPPYQ